MLPNSTSSSSSIYINPKFRNVHINPNFLNKSNGVNQTVASTTSVSIEPKVAMAPTQIYINPLFLNTCDSIASTQASNSTVHAKENFAHISMGHEAHETMATIVEPLADTKIHTRTKIFNHPIKPNVFVAANTSKIVNCTDSSMKSLIKIGSKKLVRVPAKPFAKSPKVIPKVRRPLQTKYKIIKEQSAFKIDRRTAIAKLAAVTRNIVPIVLSRKFWINESLMPSKTTTSSLAKQTALSSVSTRLKGSTLLNINGILYKSNRRKLEKTTISNPYSIKKCKSSTSKSKPSSYRRLIVRGENFLLDASGKNLIRVQTNSNQSNSNAKHMDTTSSAIIKRIDIGKITFVKKSNDTYVRTDYHKSRYHLNVAKQRSIQTLTNRMVKTNVPCPIYRKLGKCAAFVRGKCAKLHDKKLVDVCSRFLRGTCDKKPCLLSHDLTLSKMPTCKFYLQGMCFKSDCPYLHKKVNDRTEICVDFLRGFCEKAEQCTKRHEFLCPEQQSKGSCKLTRCPYSHRTSNIQIEQSHIDKPESVKVKRRLKNSKTEHKKSMKPAQDSDAVVTTEKLSLKRYFDDDKSPNATASNTSDMVEHSESKNLQDSIASSENVEHIVVVRKPIVGSLPSFIPIG